MRKIIWIGCCSLVAAACGGGGGGSGGNGGTTASGLPSPPQPGAASVIQVNASAYAVHESATQAIGTVTRTGGSGGAVSATLAAWMDGSSPRTLADSADYERVVDVF